MSKSSGFGAVLRDRWRLEPQVIYLNHGSFGATPGAVLAAHYAALVVASAAVLWYLLGVGP